MFLDVCQTWGLESASVPHIEAAVSITLLQPLFPRLTKITAERLFVINSNASPSQGLALIRRMEDMDGCHRAVDEAIEDLVTYAEQDASKAG